MVAGLQDDFAARNCKIIGISVDGVSDHEAWSKDIESSQGHAVTLSADRRSAARGRQGL